MYALTVHRLNKVLKKFKMKNLDMNSQAPNPIGSFKQFKFSTKTKHKATTDPNIQLSVKESPNFVSLRKNYSFRNNSPKKGPLNEAGNTDNADKTECATKNGSTRFKSIVNKHRLINKALLAFQLNKETTFVKNEKKQ